jgi:AcrR family transcriptional regulator
MPKIEAETVAAHRRQREEMILDAARRLLVEQGPAAVTPAAVADAVGFTRSATYRYFGSGSAILSRIVVDSFASWHDAVTAAVDAAADPPARIEAYVRATLALAAAGEHRVAVLAGGFPHDDQARDGLARRHQALTEPLRGALEQHGVTEPALVADLIDGLLGRGIARIDAGAPLATVTDTAMSLVRRALLLRDTSNPT